MIDVRWVESDNDWRAVLALRIAVFVDEQGCPADEEPDSLDPGARHLMAVESGVVLGCARLLDKGAGKSKIGRVAVRIDQRGRGIGARIMRFAVAELLDQGQKEISLEAQVPVIPFYERLGFVADGPTYLDAGIPHRHMTLRTEGIDGARPR